MASAKPPKKTDTIEIRLADEVKAAFAEQCRQQGHTVSETIRALIADRLEPSGYVRKAPAARWRIAVAGMLGAALGASVAAPSFAKPACDGRQVFEQVDGNADAASTPQQFRND